MLRLLTPADAGQGTATPKRRRGNPLPRSPLPPKNRGTSAPPSRTPHAPTAGTVPRRPSRGSPRVPQERALCPRAPSRFGGARPLRRPRRGVALEAVITGKLTPVGRCAACGSSMAERTRGAPERGADSDEAREGLWSPSRALRRCRSALGGVDAGRDHRGGCPVAPRRHVGAWGTPSGERIALRLADAFAPSVVSVARLAEVAARWLPGPRALELARNVAAALADGIEPVEETIREMIANRRERLGLALSDKAAAGLLAALLEAATEGRSAEAADLDALGAAIGAIGRATADAAVVQKRMRARAQEAR